MFHKVNCTAPFNDVCIHVSGLSEVQHYVYRQAFLRSCFFRCPCPESVPWKYYTWGGRHNPLASHKRWEKRCKILPPPNYALSSSELRWKEGRYVEVVCCKKAWNYLDGYDGWRHPTRPSNGSWGIPDAWVGPAGDPKGYYRDDPKLVGSSEVCNLHEGVTISDEPPVNSLGEAAVNPDLRWNLKEVEGHERPDGTIQMDGYIFTPDPSLGK